MKNLQLQADLEKLLSYDSLEYRDIIVTPHSGYFGYSLGIKGNVYHYWSKNNRDSDYYKICKILVEKTLL